MVKPKGFSVTYEDHQAASALAKSVVVQVVQRANPQASITFPEGIENSELGEVYLAMKLDLLDFQRKAKRHLGNASEEKIKNDLEHSLVEGLKPLAKGPHKGYHRADYVTIEMENDAVIKQSISKGYKRSKGEMGTESKGNSGLQATSDMRLSTETAVERVKQKKEQQAAQPVAGR